MITSRIVCLIILLLLCTSCLSLGHALHEDGNKDSGLDVVSTGTGTAAGATKKMTGGRKLAIVASIDGKDSQLTSENGDKFRKQMAKIVSQQNTKTSKSVGHREADEDGLVAFTADYWRAHHHPPKNN